jgi:predicted outer membrane repeat protein
MSFSVQTGTLFPTIQSGIDFALTGDTVLVAAGTYDTTVAGNVNLDTKGKAIVVKSTAGPASTIIDGKLLNRAFIFNKGETNTTKIIGFKIINGLQAGGSTAAGMLIASSPTIQDCIFEDLVGPSGGGAMFISNDSHTISPYIRSCTFTENATAIKGGALYFGKNAHARVSNSTFKGNLAYSTGIGGAIYIDTMTSIDVQIDSCVFDSNLASNGGGAIRVEGKANIFANTFVKNFSTNNGTVLDISGANAIVTLSRLNITNNVDSALKGSNSASITLTCSNFYQNGANIASGSTFNPTIPSGTLIAQNPVYCGYATGDYSLRWDSPCGPSLVPGGCTGLPIGAKGIGCTPALTLSTPSNSSIQTDNTPGARLERCGWWWVRNAIYSTFG